MTDDQEPWLEPVARAICADVARENGIGPENIAQHVNRDWHNLEDIARAAYAELKRQGQINIPDNPDLDATDGAHPAWWRGEEYGARSVVREMLKVLTEPRHNGKFSSSEMNELREKIWALRENQRTPGTVEVCGHDNCTVPAILGPCDHIGCPLRGAP